MIPYHLLSAIKVFPRIIEGKLTNTPLQKSKLMKTFLDLPTVFHITHYKSGSQWVYNVLQASSPERIMPPRIEVAQFLGQNVIQGMIYPTLYVTREAFETVSIPENHIKFVTMRDLRDSIVSWYFSASKSHREDPNLLQVRGKLNSESRNAGLQIAMRGQGKMTAAFQLSWMNSDALVVRYEDLLEDEQLYFRRIMRHCRIGISDKRLQDVVNLFSFDKRSGRRRGSEDTTSHLRKGVHGDWANHLTGELLEEFKEYFDDVLIATGYEKDRDWGLDLLPTRVQGVDISKQKKDSIICWCGNKSFEPFSPKYRRCTRCKTLVHKEIIGTTFYSATESTEAGVVMRIPEATTNVKLLQFQTRQLLSRKDTVTKLKICINYLEPGAKVLEISKESGAFVMLLQQAGFNAFGLNPNPVSREHIAFQQNILQVSMYYGSLAWQNIPDDSLDAIVLTEVLSTVADLNELLRYCTQWLKPDGKLILDDYVLNDNRSYQEMQEFGSASLITFWHKVHQHIFTRDSLNTLLMELGYPEVISMFLPHPSLSLREKYVNEKRLNTCIVASRISFEYYPVTEEALFELGSGYHTHALMDMYRELALAYETLEEERELWLQQVEILTSATPESFLQTTTIQTGMGWHSPEIDHNQRFTWVGNDSELIIHAPFENRYDMYIDLEPGPSVPETGMSLLVSQTDGVEVVRFQIQARQKIYLKLPVKQGKHNVFVLHVENGGLAVPNDPRILNFRVFGMGPYKSAQIEPVFTLQGTQDIIAFGAGWYPIEHHSGRSFRWANNNVGIIISNPSGRFTRLVLDIQSGPSLKHGIFQLELLDEDDVIVASQKVHGKDTVIFDLPIVLHEENYFRLRVQSGGLIVPNDPRILNFRVFGVGWAKE